MTDFQKSIISLINNAIDGSDFKIYPDINWQELIDFAKQHQILPLIYYGALNSESELPSNVFETLENLTYYCIAADQRQQYEIKNIRQSFDKNGIDYMLLKGSRLKYMYPKTEMRQMGDADILIRTKQYEQIRVIMSELGFTEGSESDHDLKWDKKNILHVELHKRLIPSYNKDYYAYYGDGWQLAKKLSSNSYEYVMSDEDEFIYIFTHFAKHYRDGGIGIRHITDLKIYLTSKPNLSQDYICEELKKLQLLEFYKNVYNTIQVWFYGDTNNKVTDFITNVIFGSGSYGTSNEQTLSYALKQSKSLDSSNEVSHKLIINLIFLPFKDMCIKYPILNKMPFLLPIMWVVRWFTAIFKKRNIIKKQRDTIKLIKSENIDEHQRDLNFVGLDYNFKE